MKNQSVILVCSISLAITALSGCSMTDDDPDDVPFSGISTSMDAAEATERVSSGIYDLIGTRGKASSSQSTVVSCPGKDPATYFRILHPWSFYPATASELPTTMDQLRTELPKHGWEVVEYGPDTSRNKNIRLTAENDTSKAGVNITQMSKNDPPKLSLYIVSGCFKIPDGQEIEHF